MNFTNPRKAKGNVINVTSLIDVMFLLVIFVLISARFDPEGGIAVDLPQGKSKEIPETRTYELTILYDGTMFLNKKKIKDDTELAEAIKAFRAEAKDPVLVIKADKDVSWKRIVVVTDTAKMSGQGKVNFRIKP
ncbi:MAG: biopolymer transporter ExbD [Planctomycetes bacterium]|nr:biopolymer transporter ExbD [Planctomycetota bacterium]